MSSEALSAGPLSGECVFDYHYGVASQDWEVVRRPAAADDMPGQAAFLSLLTRLRVPILNRNFNWDGNQGHRFVGAGRSFTVSQAPQSLGDRSTIPFDIVGIAQELQSKAYVTKSIRPLPSNTASDRVQLAAITNEVRILANETLKSAPDLVKLICVAWDETPTLGRHWPRLLIEAAEYGNLAEFMSSCDDSQSWDVKLEVALDVLGGLQMLHHHRVAHCDLKLENVLIFPSDDPKTHPLGVKYRAKLCDFGFSVIMSDYDTGATFSAIMGTEPWNAPELTFGTPIPIGKLPAADVYSFGLLLSRILMHGGTPFDRLSREEIRSLKKSDDSMAMYNHVNVAVFEHVKYSESQKLLIQKILLLTLLEEPEQRFPIHLLGQWLIFLGVLFRE